MTPKAETRKENLHMLDINLALVNLIIRLVEQINHLKMRKYIVDIFHKKPYKSQIST